MPAAMNAMRSVALPARIATPAMADSDRERGRPNARDADTAQPGSALLQPSRRVPQCGRVWFPSCSPRRSGDNFDRLRSYRRVQLRARPVRCYRGPAPGASAPGRATVLPPRMQQTNCRSAQRWHRAPQPKAACWWLTGAMRVGRESGAGHGCRNLRGLCHDAQPAHSGKSCQHLTRGDS